MTRDPVASLALERAALLSADIEEQLTTRVKDGMRPLIAVLAKLSLSLVRVVRNPQNPSFCRASAHAFCKPFTALWRIMRSSSRPSVVVIFSRRKPCRFGMVENVKVEIVPSPE
jgi:hypothetical protein